MRKFAILALGLIFMASCSESGNPAKALAESKSGGTDTSAPIAETSIEIPPTTTQRQPPYELPIVKDGIVSFAQKAGESLEAWEIVVDGNKTFLNYSRFPFGDLEYQGQETVVCWEKNGEQKIVGVSENRDRLMLAIDAVAGKPKQSVTVGTCTVFATLIQEDPAKKSLQNIFDSMN